MWNSFVSKISRIVAPGETSIACRDARRAKVCGGASEPLVQQETEGRDRGDDRKGTVMRVKVKMTKKEAARLLSKCKAGGVIEFRDAAQQIAQIPVNRVSVHSLALNH